MPFDITRFNVAVDTIGGGSLRIHAYKTGDTVEQVLTGGYFVGVGVFGVRPGDLIAVIFDGSAEVLTAGVDAVSASGNATVATIDLSSEIITDSDGQARTLQQALGRRLSVTDYSGFAAMLVQMFINAPALPATDPVAPGIYKNGSGLSIITA